MRAFRPLSGAHYFVEMGIHSRVRTNVLFWRARDSISNFRQDGFTRRRRRRYRIFSWQSASRVWNSAEYIKWETGRAPFDVSEALFAGTFPLQLSRSSCFFICVWDNCVYSLTSATSRRRTHRVERFRKFDRLFCSGLLLSFSNHLETLE